MSSVPESLREPQEEELENPLDDPDVYDGFYESLLRTGRWTLACRQNNISIEDYRRYCDENEDFAKEVGRIVQTNSDSKRSNKKTKEPKPKPQPNQKEKPTARPQSPTNPEVKQRPKRLKLDNPKKQEELLKALEETGNISESCRQVGITSKTYYNYLKTNPEFKQRTQKVLEIGQRLKLLDNPKKQEELLKALEETGNINESCLQVGIVSKTYYRYLRTNPEFKQRTQRALEVGQKKNKRPKLLDNPKKQEELLKALEETGNISESCRQIGITSKTYYNYLKISSEFAQKAEGALVVGRQQRKVLGNPKTRESLLKALEETGNIAESCRQIGIVSKTYYRYLRTNPEFKQRVQRALEVGQKKNKRPKLLANPKKQEELLKALEETGNISESCRRVGIVSKTYYRYLRTNPEFKQRTQRVLEVG